MQELKNVLLINCGGTEDVTQLLNSRPTTRVLVIDSRRSPPSANAQLYIHARISLIAFLLLPGLVCNETKIVKIFKGWSLGFGDANASLLSFAGLYTTIFCTTLMTER